MVKTLGLGWWEEIGIGDVKERAEETGKRSGKQPPHHPLEFTEFEDLVLIFTAEWSHWGPGHGITAEGLLALLEQCSTMGELKEKLNEKTRKQSLWDSVFSHYIEDKAQWEGARKNLLEKVIRTRHKVMHHRPMSLFELKELRKASGQIKAALHAKKREPMKEEMESMQKSLMGYAEAMRQQQEQMLRSLQPFLEYNESIQEKMRPFIEQQSRMMESMMPTAEQMARIQENIKPMLGQQSKMAENMMPTAEHLARIQENLRPFLEGLNSLGMTRPFPEQQGEGKEKPDEQEPGDKGNGEDDEDEDKQEGDNGQT